MVKFSEGARARHVCASNGAGYCDGCLAFEAVAVLIARQGRTRAVVVRSERSEFAREMVRFANRARRETARAVKRAETAAAAAKAEREAREAREREAARKAETARREAERAREAAERREAKAAAKAAKRQAARVAEQAAVIALRASMDATYRVWIMFARGARSVTVASEAPGPRYREARASRKVRGDSPGLRYREAERIAEGIERKMGASRAQQRRA